MAMALGVIRGILVGKIPLPGRSAFLFLLCSVHLSITVYYSSHKDGRFGLSVRDH